MERKLFACLTQQKLGYVSWNRGTSKKNHHKFKIYLRWNLHLPSLICTGLQYQLYPLYGCLGQDYLTLTPYLVRRDRLSLLPFSVRDLQMGLVS